MKENGFKVAVLPCNGIGRLSSTIVRQAGYRLEELRPGQVVMLSVNALAVNEEEEMVKLVRYPLLVIDACRPHCASALVRELGKKPTASLYVPDVAAEMKISLGGEKRRGLGKRGKDLAEAVAQKAAAEVDRIIADEMLSTL
ncbi:MAG: hypothetical protein GTO55_00420 [Armatimonadetes bacterium]|nr:hypothetical protein [Armatimonadota bacterium]NIM23900.1 hypothetical protein [Armatimonadota bacterium]NIM66619.1 hypothetical protein [Armatimonadota bacterium]NIM76287.1 hypothetical protein [Armatimonadota bacterium]NIN05981.1 hypothetical protein [Armatimonadota bacterium]